MKISIFGLGYVGCVSAACLASEGHDVVGIDINPIKVALINDGMSPIVEPGLSELVAEQRQAGRLGATADAASAVRDCDLTFVCIQTPSAANGSLDLEFVLRVTEEIGATLRDKPGFTAVVYRSTMLPTTMERLVLPLLAKTSGKQPGVDFGVAYHPEFLREGTAISDYRCPARTVIGASDPRTADMVASLCSHLDAPIVRCDLRTAELVKYADNAFHALKVAFANEIGALCRATGINSHQLMAVFCQDTKLNLSPTYLKPGYAFGGACLPKDLRALSYMARNFDLHVPVLESVLSSNAAHKQRALSMVMSKGRRPIGMLGLSFKDGTDDLRESPTVEMVEQLVGKGYQVCIFDPNVSLGHLMGANKAFIDRELPHIASLLVPDMQTLLAKSEVIVVSKRSAAYLGALEGLRPEQKVVDLVRMFPEGSKLEGQYDALVG
ncbi:MAG TPA: nucleotide sugar dehydrogenase [Ideonella sp.]|nr:nucleotide sugar dehydrogenase [Ideonella sp.]